MRLNRTMIHVNLGLKIFGLVLAIAIWVYINTIVQTMGGGPLAYKDIKAVEIRLMGEPLFLGKNVFVVELGRTTVDIRIRGPEQEIEKLTPVDITAYVDVSGLKSGKTYSPVVKFVLPSDVELVGAPPLIRVEIKDRNLQ